MSNRTQDNSTSTDTSEAPSYLEVEDAAPLAGSASYFKHPEHGWVPILKARSDIGSDIVMIAFGDSDTGAFLGLHRTWYSNTEQFITHSDDTGEFYTEDSEPADDTVSDLPTQTPGANNFPG